MSLTVIHAKLGRPDDPSALDQIAGAAIELVLLSAEKKGAAMQALSRLAGDELARLEGHEEASRHHARLSRIHHQRGLNMVLRGRR